jgi:hypothetical protein
VEGEILVKYSVALYAHGGFNKLFETREGHIFKLIPRGRYFAT